MDTIEQIKDAIVANDLQRVRGLYESAEFEPRQSGDFLVGSVLASSVPLVEYFLAKGVSPDAEDSEHRWHPLHYAADGSNIEMAKLLVERNANPNILDNYGNSPLWNAVLKRKHCPEMIGLLLRAGADPAHKNSAGNSPADLAARFHLELTAL